MNKCAAYTPVDGFPNSWIPCTEEAKELSLCMNHFNALAGVIIGTLAKGGSHNEVLEKILTRLSVTWSR